MAIRAVQQIMLGSVTKNEKETLETLNRIKKAGYDGIELNGFMIRPTSGSYNDKDGRNACRKRWQLRLGFPCKTSRASGCQCP